MENLSVFSPVTSACGACLSAPVERGPSRSCAVVRMTRTLSFLQFPVVSSISVTVQWTCCVTHMTRTPQWLKKNVLVIPAHFISLRMVAELGLLF